MKIEHEKDKDYRRWTIETNPWIDKSLAVAFYSLVAGSGGFAIVLSITEVLSR